MTHFFKAGVGDGWLALLMLARKPILRALLIADKPCGWLPEPIREFLRAMACSRGGAEPCDHLAAIYSMTSSARASSVGGTSRPSAFAVFRFMTSSYFTGACTGSSAGFSPLRMRST
jgi:hypothetical protein